MKVYVAQRICRFFRKRLKRQTVCQLHDYYSTVTRQNNVLFTYTDGKRYTLRVFGLELKKHCLGTKVR